MSAQVQTRQVTRCVCGSCGGNRGTFQFWLRHGSEEYGVEYETTAEEPS